MLFTQLRAQTSHVHVDRARAAVVLVAPHSTEQRLTGEDPVRVGGEEAQELVLHVREVHDPSGDRRLVGLEVHRESAVVDARRDAVVARATKSVAQSRREFAHVEGSDDEVVEEVLAKRQVVELVVVEQQDDRTDAARSRLRNWRQRFIASVKGKAEALMTAPANPSAGSSAVISLSRPRGGHRGRHARSRRRPCGPALRTRARRGRRRCSQQWEVAFEFEGRDLAAVGVPFGALVAQEPLDLVFAERLVQQRRASP